MRADAVMAFATRNTFSISECEELAKDLGAYDKMTFDLVGPKGRKACRWLDAYYGIFQMEGSDSAFQASQFKYARDLHCENLNPNLPASVDRSPEGGNHEDGCRAKHESAVPSEASADAPPSAPSLQTPQGGDS